MTGKKANTSVTLTGSSFPRWLNLIDRLQRKKKKKTERGKLERAKEREREKDAEIFS